MIKIIKLSEQYFGIFLISGLTLGLIYPADTSFLLSMLKPFLMVMLFLVFLKTDVAQVFKKMKNYRQVTFLTLMYMVAIPVLFFLAINLFNQELAVAILLLTAMPAGAASPALTDIVKGNTALSTSIVIMTSIIAPFTVPLLIWTLTIENLSIDPLLIFKDLATLIFLPMAASQFFKRYFPVMIGKSSHLFTSVNIILLSLTVYAIMGSQRETILNDPLKIFWQCGFLYIVFILLHVIGFLMGYKEDKEGKIATTIGAAYMNNGMAIVLAAIYFSPSILVLLVLSEIPWNTLIAPFKKIVIRISKQYTSH